MSGACIPDTSSQKYKALGDGQYCSCLDISVANDAAQTYPCKVHEDAQGEGHCGDMNQHWKLQDDGTLQVATAPTALCDAWKSEDCAKPLTKNPCEPVCLQAPVPKSAVYAQNAGKGCINTEPALGYDFVFGILGCAIIYFCGGLLYNRHVQKREPGIGVLGL
eukprot:SAG31_NODE_8882_length_1368_cov_1.052009_2_plen_162_part_01